MVLRRGGHAARSPAEKVYLFFDLFESGGLTAGHVADALSFFPSREATVERFVSRGAAAVLEHADTPFALRIPSSMAWAVRTEPPVSRAAAAAVLEALEQVAALDEFRGDISPAQGDREHGED